MYEKGGGSDHPDLAITLMNLADLLIADEKCSEALVASRRALAIVEKTIGPAAEMSAIPLFQIGSCELKLGHAADAVAPLEKSVKLIDPANGDPGNLNAFRFGLAKALWEANRERPRAHDLAKQALEYFTSIGEPGEKQRALIAAWLKSHAL